MLDRRVKVGQRDFRKEELGKGVAGFTYKSLLGVIFRNRRLRVEREDNTGVSQRPLYGRLAARAGWAIRFFSLPDVKDPFLLPMSHIPSLFACSMLMMPLFR